MEQQQPIRILLMDDDPSFTRLVKFHIEAAGSYEVRVESRGKNVCAAALEFRPHIVLSAIVMPDMDGTEVARQLQSDHRLRHIPIAFLAAILTHVQAYLDTSGIRAYPRYSKPVEPNALIHFIHDTIKGPQAGAA